MTQTPFTIIQSGDVELNCRGYGLVGSDDVVCFYIDLPAFADICLSGLSDSGCPTLYIALEGSARHTIIEFGEFFGWRVHSFGQGKAAPIALVRIAAER